MFTYFDVMKSRFDSVYLGSEYINVYAYSDQFIILGIPLLIKERMICAHVREDHKGVCFALTEKEFAAATK